MCFVGCQEVIGLLDAVNDLPGCPSVGRKNDVEVVAFSLVACVVVLEPHAEVYLVDACGIDLWEEERVAG